jgi:glycosyltransferase involved in cell wall biosynthesis
MQLCRLKTDVHVAPKSAAARVLFAIPSMGLGGSERVMLNLLRHIDRERFEPHLAVLERVGACLQDVPRHVQIHELGVRRARSAVFPFVNLCWNVRPQVVLSTSAHLNSAVVAAQPLLPRQTTLLTRQGADINSPEFACSWLRLLVYKRVYKRAGLVICQSDYMKEELVRQFGLAQSKVVRIYNPVDIDSIAALAGSEPSPFTNVSPNLLGVGRFSHEKGFDLLLKCMPLVREAMPGAFLTLVGDGPDFAALKTMQRALGLNSCVRFAGIRGNPYPFIKSADLLVLPSRCEAFPNVVLEAIALGTSVVASNCTAALREISSCTKLMQVAKHGTPEALAATIICTLVNTTARTKAGPEPQFEARFGIRTVIREYERVLWQSIHTMVTNSSHANALA